MNLNIIKKNQKQIILFLIGVAVGYYLIPKLQTFVVGGQEGEALDCSKLGEMEAELAVILKERPNNWVVDGMELARNIRTCENDAASGTSAEGEPEAHREDMTEAEHPQETIQQARDFYTNYHNTVRDDSPNWTTSIDRAADECHNTSASAMKNYSPGKRVICRALHEAYTMTKIGDIREADLSLTAHERAAEAANNCKEKLETLLGPGITIDKDISDSRCDDLINICQWTQNKHTGKCSSE